jgi:hypothetical protein
MSTLVKVARTFRNEFRKNQFTSDDYVMLGLTTIIFYTMAIAMAPII